MKKDRKPLITKDTYKVVSSSFIIAMWIIAIICIVQTISSCRTAFIITGTTLSAYEAFSYCAMVWGVVFILITIIWTLLIFVFFMIGRFVGKPENIKAPKKDENCEVITVAVKTEEPTS